MSEIVKATFELEKSTKNTYRYQEKAEGQPPKIGCLYVQKWAFKGDPPRSLTVTVTG